MPPPANDPNNEQHTPTRSGGADSALDMRDERDRGLVRRAIRDWSGRWKGVTPDRKAALTDVLFEAGEECRSLIRSDNPETKMEAIKAVGGIMRTVVMMEGQVQADQHREDHNARLDAGLATANIGVAKGREELNRLLASDPAAMEAALALSEKLAAGGMPDALPSP